MAAHASTRGDTRTARERKRHDRVTWVLAYAACLGLAAIVGLLAVVTAPKPFTLAALIVLLMCGVMVLRPVVGIYLVAGLTAVGDIATLTWYPFTKNLSSGESILFVSNQLSVSPLELCLFMLTFGWVLEMAGRRRWQIVRGQLLVPLLIFTAFLLIGFGNGLATGGDSRIALLELRPMLYLPLLYLVATNVLRSPQQYVRLYDFLVAGIVVHAVLSWLHIRKLTPLQLQSPESIMQHSSALIMNALVVLLASFRLLKVGSWFRRAVLLLACVPAGLVYLAAKRRAAIIGIVAAGILLFVVLFWMNRKRFRRLAPLTLIVAVGYLGAFWSSQSGAGFPAQAIKSVIAPNQRSERDLSSDIYRYAETYDVQYTIRAKPLLGIGFGQPFYRPIALPGITDFPLAAYTPHNSLLWVWMKSGVFGFIAMLYVFGLAMRSGANAVLAAGRNAVGVTTLTSVCFVLMYAVYTYVDIAWDQKSVVVLALAMANIDTVTRVHGRAAPVSQSTVAVDPRTAAVPVPA